VIPCTHVDCLQLISLQLNTAACLLIKMAVLTGKQAMGLLGVNVLIQMFVISDFGK
jgi:hypothetical protein